MADELGVALEWVAGTGPDGRITDADLVRHASSRANAVPQPAVDSTDREAAQESEIIGLRRTIAERMALSKRSIPHFTYVEELDLTELESLRGELNRRRTPDQSKLTLLPFLVRAVVKLVPEFPRVNARYDEEARILRSYRAVHMGIATQTHGGLMVPVIRHAEALDLWGCAREIVRLSVAAREGRATRKELLGSTITLTSLGALGGISATPIINHPEVAIIGPNKMIDRPVVRQGLVLIRTMMNLSCSFDHRIVDGYEAARFVQRLKLLIEQPALLFVEGL
jgi:2-oxoisovalerate dehydrogenase E2 component (dihydrolipoyl transacylase)